MAGSHHSGRAPVSVFDVGGRNLQTILGRHRVAEADLRRAIYLQPYGAGYHWVRNLANDEVYVVGDAGGGTYAPQSVVALGSFTGQPGEFILSKAPAGYRGAARRPVTPAYRPYSPELPAVDPTHLGFFLSGGVVVAAYYFGPSLPGADLGSAAETSEAIGGSFLRTDSRGYVNDLCWLYLGTDNLTLCLFDPTAEAVYRTSKPSGYHFSGVHYANGYLWWCEGEDVEHGSVGAYATYFRLRRANCDLTDIQTIGSFEFDNDAGDGPGVSLDWSQGFSAHINLSTGLVVEALWGEGEVQGSIRITWAYAGTQTHDSSSAWEDPLPESDVPNETPVAASDHATYGTPLQGGVFPLTI